jgi:hypothetical protein
VSFYPKTVNAFVTWAISIGKSTSPGTAFTRSYEERSMAEFHVYVNETREYHVEAETLDEAITEVNLDNGEYLPVHTVTTEITAVQVP